MIAARFRPGAVSESSSSHLPPSVASKSAKPVMFPLGRSSRATMPLATGSLTLAKMIGIVRVSRWMARVAGVAPFRVTLRRLDLAAEIYHIRDNLLPEVRAVLEDQLRWAERNLGERYHAGIENKSQ